MFTEEEIRAAIAQVDAGLFGANLTYLPQVGSTNDILRDLANTGAAEGTLVLTDEQVQGRGRMGRTWNAPAGSSLLMSILFRPTLKPADAHRLVMVAGLAAVQAGEAISGLRIDVKWPNDLQITGKKLAGILPESAIEGMSLKWVIIGIGINVNQDFSADNPLAGQATSLASASGHTINRAQLLGKVMAGLHRWNTQLHSTILTNAWQDRCVTLGKKVQIALGDSILVGVAEDIDDNGALWLRGDDGQRTLLTLGEATLLAEAE